MTKSALLKTTFAFALLAILCVTVAPLSAVPKIKPIGPGGWQGNCPTAFCSAGQATTYVQRCEEYEYTTDCYRLCSVYRTDTGTLCKTACAYG